MSIVDQYFTTSIDLASGGPQTQIFVGALQFAIPAQTAVILNYGQAQSITVVLSVDAQLGDTVINVNSFSLPVLIPAATLMRTQGLRTVIWKNLSTTAPLAGGNSGQLPVPDVDLVNFAITITGATGTSPGITFFVETLGNDNKWYVIYSTGLITTLVSTGTSIGPGMATPQLLTSNVRVRWVVSGTASPTVTFSGFMEGK